MSAASFGHDQGTQHAGTQHVVPRRHRVRLIEHRSLLYSPSVSTVWYFAYGSNMQTATFRGRRGVEFHRALPGRVEGWRLVLDKPPLFPIGEAYANIIPDAAAEVMGVLYEVDVSELAHIELTEGVPLDNYRRVQIAVRPLDDPSAQLVQALSLTSEARDETLRPSERYMGVIIEGALEHGLPEEYIAFLRSVPSQPESPAAARWRPMLDEIFKRLRHGDETALQSAGLEALFKPPAGVRSEDK